MVAIAQRFDCRFDNVIRRWKIWLSDTQIDHIHAAGRQFRCACKNCEGIFFANTAKTVDCLYHDFCV